MASLIVALDGTVFSKMLHWVVQPLRAENFVDGFKVGPALLTGTAPALIREHLSMSIVDNKLYDIPNTVRSAVASQMMALHPFMTTVSALAGGAAIRAARDEADRWRDYPLAWRPLICAVTALTSLDDGGLAEVGISNAGREQTLRLAALAVRNGAEAVTCAAPYVSALRREYAGELKLLVPGTRIHGTPEDDQYRVGTPQQAARDGADWIVVGRAITQSPNPMQVAREYKRLIALGVSER